MSLASSRPKPILLSQQPFTNEPRQMLSTLIDSVLVGNANWLTRMTFSLKLNTESKNWLTTKERANQPFNELQINRVSCNPGYPFPVLLLTLPNPFKINAKHKWSIYLCLKTKR